MDGLLVLGVIAALPVLFVVPGWLVLRRLGVSPMTALYCGLGVTAAYAAAAVGLGLVLPWSVRATCLGALAVLVVVTGYCLATAPAPLLPSRRECAGMLVFLAAYVAAAAFVAVPSDPGGAWPPGTVGGGRVDTPRWWGLPTDNTLPYRTGQVAFYKQSDQLRANFGGGWWVSDRTPLVGLDFAFSVAAFDAHLNPDNPDLSSGLVTEMQVKDSYAYWLYNQVSILLAAAVVLGAFYLAMRWKGDARIALAAALVAALAPGLFLNEIYTWPKPAIAYFVLCGFALALRKRAVGAGAFAALAYLCHPAGAFWAVSIAVVLMIGEAPRALMVRLGRFIGAAVAMVLPWEAFTSLYMHAFSKWLFWPLGASVSDRSDFGNALSQAWQQFSQRGIVGNIWVRIESTSTSLLPADLGGPGLANDQPHSLDAQIYWARAHGFSIWGMLGLILFPATILYLARHWPRDSALLLRMIVPYLIIAILAAGLPDTWSSQSAYPLIGILAIGAAQLLLSSRPRAKWFLWAAIAFELLTTAYGTEYRPYNAPTGIILLFAFLAIAAQLALLGTLASTIGLLSPPRRLLGHPRQRAAPLTT